MSQFLGHFLLGGGYLEVYLVFLDRLLRATTKNICQLFLEKVHPAPPPPGKILAMPLTVIS